MTTTWADSWRSASGAFWEAEQPGEHFMTSAGELVAEHLAALALEVDTALGHPEDFAVVDLGAGDGSLLAAVRSRCPALAGRARWIGVDVRPIDRDGLESRVASLPAPLEGAPFAGIVMAHEWLDELPCDVVERDASGRDRVVVLDAGGEALGPALDDVEACAAMGIDAIAARDWLARWWPLRHAGDRAEVGIARDAAWRWMTGLVQRGVAVASDYGTVREDRLALGARGTLRGHRHGNALHPRADGSMGLTADVAVDACVAAVEGTTRTTQRDELAWLCSDELTSPAVAERYFQLLRLRDPAGMGRFTWLRWEAP